MRAREGIAFFLPAHNEGQNLPFVVGEAVSYLRAHTPNFTVIIVNDGSTDNSAAVIDDLIALYPEYVTHVTHEKNRGYGGALRSGFTAALETGYEWIGFCDADGQFRPHEIGKLLGEALHKNASIAIGCRVNRADGRFRLFLGRTWHHVSGLILNHDGIDVDCGFKLFRREVVEALEPLLVSQFATVSPEMLSLAKRIGATIVNVEVSHSPRQWGEQSGANLRVVMRSGFGLFAVRVRHMAYNHIKRVRTERLHFSANAA